MVIDGRASRLNDEDVLISDRLSDGDGRLLIRVLEHDDLSELDADPEIGETNCEMRLFSTIPFCHLLGQVRMAVASKNLDGIHQTRSFDAIP